jgi:cobyrinic acid a,c-diamide synthase
MCGIFDASAQSSDILVIGYREATAQTASPVAAVGARLTGYKHHRTQVSPRAGTAAAWTWSGGRPEGFVWRNVHASYLTLHWAGAPDIARRVVAAAASASAHLAEPEVAA